MMKFPVAVVESEIRVAEFRQMAQFCVKNLMRLELTGVFGTKRCRTMPKITRKFIREFRIREQSNFSLFLARRVRHVCQ